MRAAIVIILTTFLVSCSTEPVAIEYGQDQCSACKMIISDSRFGAELVTTKGKVYKYDAIECLIPEVLKNGTNHYKHIMVTDFYSPGKLVDAHATAFLISPAVPSPMGANLSAYASEALAIGNRGEALGEVYDWEALLNDLINIERFSYQ